MSSSATATASGRCWALALTLLPGYARIASYSQTTVGGRHSCLPTAHSYQLNAIQNYTELLLLFVDNHTYQNVHRQHQKITCLPMSRISFSKALCFASLVIAVHRICEVSWHDTKLGASCNSPRPANDRFNSSNCWRMTVRR